MIEKVHSLSVFFVCALGGWMSLCGMEKSVNKTAANKTPESYYQIPSSALPAQSANLRQSADRIEILASSPELASSPDLASRLCCLPTEKSKEVKKLNVPESKQEEKELTEKECRNQTCKKRGVDFRSFPCPPRHAVCPECSPNYPACPTCSPRENNCPICIDKLKRTIELYCGHRFCAWCFEQEENARREGKVTVSCPLCRREYTDKCDHCDRILYKGDVRLICKWRYGWGFLEGSKEHRLHAECLHEIQYRGALMGENQGKLYPCPVHKEVLHETPVAILKIIGSSDVRPIVELDRAEVLKEKEKEEASEERYNTLLGRLPAS